MRLLGLDFETTGLDFEKDRIIEIGAVLWCTVAAMPLRMMSIFVRHPDGPPITPEIEKITGITQAIIDEHGHPPTSAFTNLGNMARSWHTEAVVAHNGTGFDKPMMEKQAARMGLKSPLVECREPGEDPLPWIDTCIDVPYPERITTRKLTHLAAEHGFLNPFAHRAVFDVLTMLRVMQPYPIEQIIESARQPNVTLIALVSFDDKEKAKERGYRWEPADKTWRKTLKAHKVEQELADCATAGFKTRILQS